MLQMPISRKANARILVVTLLGVNLIAFFPAMRASIEIRRFCTALAPGTPSTEVQSRAAAEGYSYDPLDPKSPNVGEVRVEHSSSLGRAYCDVTFDKAGRLATKKLAD